MMITMPYRNHCSLQRCNHGWFHLCTALLLILFLLVSSSFNVVNAKSESDEPNVVLIEQASAASSGLNLLRSSSNSQLSQHQQQRRRRAFICFGILRDCNDDNEDNSSSSSSSNEESVNDENATSTTASDSSSTSESGGSSSSGGGGGGGSFVDRFCLGIFRKCNDDSDNNDSSTTTTNEGDASGGTSTTNTTESSSSSTSESDNSKCPPKDDSKFLGGRPIFGDCSYIRGIIDQIFNNTSNSENADQGDNGSSGSGIDSSTSSNSDYNGPLGLGLLPEGGLLWKIFNKPEDQTIFESLIESLGVSDGSVTNALTSDFLDDWAENAITTNDTCSTSNNATDVADSSSPPPPCLDSNGDKGYWVCRTLADPFTGLTSSKTVCIGEGQLLVNNDECGCCEVPTADGNGTVTACPNVCPCTCDLDGQFNNGVIVQVTTIAKDSDNVTISNRCADPAWAVSATTRFPKLFTCVSDCSLIGTTTRSSVVPQNNIRIIEPMYNVNP